MTSKLKPCPFCGSEAELSECPNCGDLNIMVAHADDCWMREYEGVCDIPSNEKELYLTAWNTRAERTCHVETVPLGIHDDTTADVCSECRVPLDGDEYYCPNCGARVVS